MKRLSGAVAYQDDILLHGSTDSELRKRLIAVKERLQAKHFTINETKCVSFSETLSFLGYEISAKRIKPAAKHVRKILDLQPPNNVKQVGSFIGLVNYLGRMIPNYAAKTQCINELRQKENDFKWTEQCQ